MAKDPTITAKITWQEIGEACSSDRLPSEASGGSGGQGNAWDCTSRSRGCSSITTGW